MSGCNDPRHPLAPKAVPICSLGSKTFCNRVLGPQGLIVEGIGCQGEGYVCMCVYIYVYMYRYMYMNMYMYMYMYACIYICLHTPAAPNYHLEYHLIETIKLLIEVHWGYSVLDVGVHEDSGLLYMRLLTWLGPSTQFLSTWTLWEFERSHYILQ